jgi:hypothetical protein
LAAWLKILDLANNWQFVQVKKLAARQLEREQFDPIRKIELYHRYGLDRTLLIPSYAALCCRSEIPSVAECNILGMETVVMLFTAREQARSRGSQVNDEELHAIIQDAFKLAVAPAVNGDQSPNSGGSVNSAFAHLSNLTERK